MIEDWMIVKNACLPLRSQWIIMASKNVNDILIIKLTINIDNFYLLRISCS